MLARRRRSTRRGRFGRAFGVLLLVTVAAEVPAQQSLEQWLRTAHVAIDAAGGTEPDFAAIEVVVDGLDDAARAGAELRVAVVRARWLAHTEDHAAAAELADELWTFERMRSLPPADRAHVFEVLERSRPAADRFRAGFLRFVRDADEQPEAKSTADYELLFELLERLSGWIDELPAGRRAATRFYLGTWLADLRLRQNRFDDAARLARLARAQAQRDGVWSDYYRAKLLLVAWQCLPDDELDTLLREERGFIEAESVRLFGKPERFAGLALQLGLLRCAVLFLDGEEQRGLRDLQALADRTLPPAGPVEGEWPIKCLTELVWRLLLRSDYDRAELYLRRLPQALARYPLGLIALRRGDYDRAVRAGKALARRDPRYRYLVGEALEKKGDYAAAAVEYRAVLDVAPSGVDRIIALRGLGDCELGFAEQEADDAPARGEHLARARAHYEAALSVAEAAAGDPHVDAERVQILAQLGRTLERSSDLHGAHAYFDRSLRLLDRERRKVAVDPFGASWLTEAYLRGVDGVLRVGARLRRDPFESLAALDLAKARTLLDWMAEPPRLANAGVDLARAARSLALTENPKQLDEQRRALERARRMAETAVVGATSLDAGELRAHVRASPDTLFLSYWIGERRAWLCWADGRTGEGGQLELGPRDEALSRLDAARRVAQDPSTDPWPALDAAASLFVPSDVVDRVQPPGTRVVFCPDDRLGRLPFEALRVDGRPLGTSCPVERVPSLTVHARLRERSSQATGVCVVDSVDAPDAERQLGLDGLAFSDYEASLVTRAYGETERLSGSRATLAELQSLLRGRAFDLVHVSAHAILNPYLPTATMLVLADGPVAVPSLAGLDLGGAVLVLSACSTATGESRGGEGEIGLVAWPFAAGARAAVGSLWMVNQQSTADLMGQFHAARAGGIDEAAAMREARAVLAESSQYAHPHYWAGFAVYAAATGDAAPGGAGWTRALGVAAFAALLAWIVACLRRRGS